MSEPPLSSLLDTYPGIGVLQDATYRPIAEHLFEGCHELPCEMAIDLIVQFLRNMHALPLVASLNSRRCWRGSRSEEGA